jgi:small subunit ribosomal protein S20
MSKKQRNRKTIAQNKRNRMINRRYISTIKTLFKLFNLGKNKDEKESFLPKLNSIIDKAVKKNVIHKNTAARKKSRISRLYTHSQ